MILLDTCALLWWTLDPQELSDKATVTCNTIINHGALISAISIWEIGIKLKKGKLEIGSNLEDYVNRLKQLGTVEIIAVDEDIWMKNCSLEWNHPDPADRTIVATAELNGVPIVTKDEIIRAFYPRTIC